MTSFTSTPRAISSFTTSRSPRSHASRSRRALAIHLGSIVHAHQRRSEAREGQPPSLHASTHSSAGTVLLLVATS
jgi:hypothetical protein